mgnify:CR=1 FL=1
MQQPSIGLLKTITAGFTERTVKPGSHVSFTVQRKLADNSWVVRLLGRELRVVSDLQLQVGSRLRATVQFESGKLLLKIDQQFHALNTILENSSLKDTPENRALIQAFMAQGLPIREADLQAAHKLFSQLETQNAQAARLVAVLQDKGLLLTAEQFRRMQSYIWGEEQYGGQEGRQESRQQSHQEGREQHEGREQRQEGQGRRQHPGQHSGQEADQKRQRQPARKIELSKSVTEDVKEQLGHRTTDGTLLHLFNHRHANHDNWIIIPIKFQGEDRGVLRLQVSRMGRAGRFTLTFHLKTSNSTATWHFAGSCGQDGSKVEVYRGSGASGRPASEILSKLQQKLNNLRFEIDDTIKEGIEFEPFGPGGGSAFKRVDTTA